MSVTLLTEILGVRSLLHDPLPQSPTPEDIASELEAVYQRVTNITNNTGNAWQRGSVSVTTVAGTSAYQITPTLTSDFYKALIVTTTPSDTTMYPEYVLEFAEVEHLPQEWSWLSQNHGQLYYSTHASQMVAFYRVMGANEEEIWCEFRPVPDKTETYKILYQVGNWWDTVLTGGSGYGLPNPEFRFYFRALAAQQLLHKAAWSYDKEADDKQRAQIDLTLQRRIAMDAPVFESHIRSLDQADSIRMESWGDDFLELI